MKHLLSARDIWPRRNVDGKTQYLINNRWVSRQRAHQKLKQMVGECRFCKEPIHPESYGLCERHILEKRKQARERTGGKARKADDEFGVKARNS